MKIGVIGCGNMASAVVKGLYSVNKALDFFTYTPTYTRAKKLAEMVKGKSVETIDELNICDAIIIGCKPQQFTDLTKSIRDSKAFNCNNKWFISIMAAISVKKIESELGSNRVTRIMPSIPMELNLGITLIFDNYKTNSSYKDTFFTGLMGSSKVYFIKSEDEFDKVTTISSSGPAYIYYLTKVFQEKLEEWGLDRSNSRELVTQLLKGSVNIMENNRDIPLDTLIGNVTSKKGVTIEAIDSFTSLEVNNHIKESIDKAVLRSNEISKNYS